jgi:YD repeat-containing protein
MTFTYDAAGKLLTRTEQATTDASGVLGAAAIPTGPARTWTYTYNSVGHVLTVTGPRTDVKDSTTYAYDGQGNLTSVTNAAGQSTTLSNYDANGRVGRITDPNGTSVDLTYHPRGWVSSRSVTAGGVSLTTSFDYDGVGQLKKVTLPDGSYVTNTYDDAHRLTDIADSLGNSIHYTLDYWGNRITEQSTDFNGMLSRQISRVYDTLNQLTKVTGGAQ